MIMTVQQLIDELQQVKDKSMPVIMQITNHVNAMRIVKPANKTFEIEVCVRDAKNWFKDTDKTKALKIIGN